MGTINSHTNAPDWRTIHSKLELSEKLSPLTDLIHNLWWSWNAEATELFEALDPGLWQACERNPVLLLQHLTLERIQEILNDEGLMKRIGEVLSLFREYMSREPDQAKPTVAYFSMEYGLTNVLKIYSGGLGILAGDYLKEASDSRVDLTGVGLLFRYGYFRQTLSPDGHQIAEYQPQNFEELPIRQVLREDGSPLILAVPYPGRNIYANIWKVNIGRIELYLMDTDNNMNSDLDRPITHELYGGDLENRIKQEYLLGIGGIQLLNTLGIRKEVYHCNEGHVAFINIQRLLDLIEGKGLEFNQALEVVRASGLYTVHTPVPAGHDYFDEALLGKYMGSYPARLGISWQEFVDMGRADPGSQEKFSMSVFALNTCLQANGVSLLHEKVSRVMFQPVWKGYFAEELYVGHVTNGVHMPTWTSREMKALYKETFSPDFYTHQSDAAEWSPIQSVPDEKLWKIRLDLKKLFIRYLQQQFKAGAMKNRFSPAEVYGVIERFNANALFVGFGRRFATYKRAQLLFSDTDRLAKLVNNEQYPVIFLFAGKAHPADGAGQDLIKRVIDISRMPEFLGKILFLEDYDMQLAKRMISGVDIWLNTPVRLMEASGTSGQKALMNGALNFSVLDGWWYEAFREDAGWALSDKQIYDNEAYQDLLDAEYIYHTFEHTILPLYYKRDQNEIPADWIQYIKNSIAHIAPQYTTKRMMDEYTNKFYRPLADRTRYISENQFEKAKELAAWKEQTVAGWDGVEVVSIAMTDTKGQALTGPSLLLNGNEVTIEIVIDRKEMKENLGIDMVLTSYDPETHTNRFVASTELTLAKEEGSRLYFSDRYVIRQSGIFSYAFRMFPKNKDMAHRMDFAYIRWI